MNLSESLLSAVDSLRANKLRAILTMLGVIIGVAAVIALLSIGNGVSASITDEISAIGTNLILISTDPDNSDGYPALSLSDVAALTDDGAHIYTMAGAMGGATMMGLGLALARPDRRVLVVTGDGELLMNIGSLASTTALGRGHIAYSMAMGAGVQMTRELSTEWSCRGVRVNCVTPAQVVNPSLTARMEQDPTLEGRFLRGIPAGRLGRPGDIQGLAVLLASDASSWITGAIIPMDGGNLAMNAGGALSDSRSSRRSRASQRAGSDGSSPTNSSSWTTVASASETSPRRSAPATAA